MQQCCQGSLLQHDRFLAQSEADTLRPWPNGLYKGELARHEPDPRKWLILKLCGLAKFLGFLCIPAEHEAFAQQ